MEHHLLLGFCKQTDAEGGRGHNQGKKFITMNICEQWASF